MAEGCLTPNLCKGISGCSDMQMCSLPLLHKLQANIYTNKALDQSNTVNTSARYPTFNGYLETTAK